MSTDVIIDFETFGNTSKAAVIDLAVIAYNSDPEVVESFEELVQYRNFVYRKVIELIDLRIENYEKIIQDFDNNEIYSTLNPNLRNSFSEYFDEVSLPRKMKMELSKN